MEKFQSISSYLEEKINESKVENLPKAGANLLELLRNDPTEASRIISFNEGSESIYSKYAIFKYIKPDDFFNVFVKLKNADKTIIISSLRLRYERYLD